MLWWMYALLAAVLWGVVYAISGRLLGVLSPVGLYILTALPAVTVALLTPHNTVAQARRFLEAGPAFAGWAALHLLCGIIATLSLYKAIQGSNPTYVSLIEITYPVFVALFAFLLFREQHLTPGVLAGAALVLAGVSLIILASAK